ncbi:MAG: hypothetical protein M1420_04815 [Actinobacteria bacterium]|jgi:hypothetical protein|nr:hypothetical protein [Actinomycetota bacterium]
MVATLGRRDEDAVMRYYGKYQIYKEPPFWVGRGCSALGLQAGMPVDIPTLSILLKSSRVASEHITSNFRALNALARCQPSICDRHLLLSCAPGRIRTCDTRFRRRSRAFHPMSWNDVPPRDLGGRQLAALLYRHYGAEFSDRLAVIYGYVAI